MTRRRPSTPDASPEALLTELLRRAPTRALADELLRRHTPPLAAGASVRDQADATRHVALGAWLRAALDETQGDRSRAAARLGVARSSVCDALTRYPEILAAWPPAPGPPKKSTGGR